MTTWGRKKSGARKEPQFGVSASLAALRLSPEDRIPAPAEENPPKNSPKSPARRKPAPSRKPEPDPDEEEPTPAPKPRERRTDVGKRNKPRGGLTLSRLCYWVLVIGIWAGIVLIGAVVWAGAHLPPIQSLQIPKRPPTIAIT